MIIFAVTCMIWEGDEVKKAELGVLDISWAIIQRVDQVSEPSEYVRLAIVFSFIAMCMPLGFRSYFASNKLEESLDLLNIHHLLTVLSITVGSNWRLVDEYVACIYIVISQSKVKYSEIK